MKLVIITFLSFFIGIECFSQNRSKPKTSLSAYFGQSYIPVSGEWKALPEGGSLLISLYNQRNKRIKGTRNRSLVESRIGLELNYYRYEKNPRKEYLEFYDDTQWLGGVVEQYWKGEIKFIHHLFKKKNLESGLFLNQFLSLTHSAYDVGPIVSLHFPYTETESATHYGLEIGYEWVLFDRLCFLIRSPVNLLTVFRQKVLINNPKLPPSQYRRGERFFDARLLFEFEKTPFLFGMGYRISS